MEGNLTQSLVLLRCQPQVAPSSADPQFDIPASAEARRFPQGTQRRNDGGQSFMPRKRANPPNRKERRNAKFAVRPKQRIPVEPMAVPPNIKRLLFLVSLRWKIKLRYASQRWLWPKAANRARQTPEQVLAPGDWVLFCLACATTIALQLFPNRNPVAVTIALASIGLLLIPPIRHLGWVRNAPSGKARLLRLILLFFVMVIGVILYGRTVWPVGHRHILTEKERALFEKPLQGVQKPPMHIQISCPLRMNIHAYMQRSFKTTSVRLNGTWMERFSG